MDGFVVDISKPVLDLSYQNMYTVEVETSVPSVKALIVSGNPLADWSFVPNFSHLQVLHGDAAGLRGFGWAELNGMKELKHLIVRLNEINNFEDLPTLESLQTLDVSLNPFEPNAEDSLTVSLPRLERLLWGFVNVEEPAAGVLTVSTSALNGFRLFKKFFLERFYPEDDMHFAELDSAKVGNVLFKAMIDGNTFHVEAMATTAQRVENARVVVTCYLMIPGFEIEQTYQRIVDLQDICMGFSVSVGSRFDHREMDYPTTREASERDRQVFQLLRDRKRQQLGVSLFKIVTLETMKQVVVFLFDKDKQLRLFDEFLESQQYQIAGLGGMRVAVLKNQIPLNQTKLTLEALQGTAQYYLDKSHNLIKTDGGPVPEDYVPVDPNFFLEDIQVQEQRTVVPTLANHPGFLPTEPTAPAILIEPSQSLPPPGQINYFNKPLPDPQRLDQGSMTPHQLNMLQNSEVLGTTGTSLVLSRPVLQGKTQIGSQVNAFSTTNTQLQLHSVTPGSFPSEIPKVHFIGEMTVHKLVRIATQGLSFAYIYKTRETKQQLERRLVKTVQAIFGNKITRSSEMITEAIREFNSRFNDVPGNEEDRPFVPLRIKFRDQQFVFKVRLEKIALQAGDEGFLIHNRHWRRFLLFECYINTKQKYVYFSEQNCKMKPIITEAGLKRTNNYLIVKVFEARRYQPEAGEEEQEEKDDGEDQEEWEFFETKYRLMRFQFYRDGALIHETRNRYLPLLKKYEGNYAVIVTVFDDDHVVLQELETNSLFLHKCDELDYVCKDETYEEDAPTDPEPSLHSDSADMYKPQEAEPIEEFVSEPDDQALQTSTPACVYQIVKANPVVGGDIVVDVKSLIKEIEPTFFAFNYRPPAGQFRTGLAHSRASVAARSLNGLFRVTVHPDLMDQGKLLYLYVCFATRVNQLILITKRPIALGATPSSVRGTVFNMQEMRAARCDVTLSGGAVDMGRWSSGVQNSVLVPLSQETLQAGDLTEAMMAQDVQLETLDARMDYCVVSNQLGDGLEGDHFTNLFETMVSDVNKECQTDLGANTALYSLFISNGGSFLIQFPSERERAMFQLSYQRELGQLFEVDREFPVPSYILDNYNYQLSVVEYLRELTRVQLNVSCSEGGEVTTGKTLSFSISAHRPELLFANNFIAITGQDGELYYVEQLTGAKAVIPEGFGGFKAHLVVGQLVKPLYKDGAFTVLEDAGFENQLINRIERGTFTFSCQAGFRVVQLIGDGSKLQVRDDKEIYLQCAYGDLRVNYIAGSTLAVSDSFRSIACHFDDADLIDAWLLMASISGHSFYE